MSGFRDEVHDVAARLTLEMSHDQIAAALRTLTDEEQDEAMRLAAKRLGSARTNAAQFQNVQKIETAAGDVRCKNGYRVPKIRNVLRNDDIYLCSNGLMASILGIPPKSKSGEVEEVSTILPLKSSTINNPDSRARRLVLWGKIWGYDENKTRLGFGTPAATSIWHEKEAGVLKWNYILYARACRHSPQYEGMMKSKQAKASHTRKAKSLDNKRKSVEESANRQLSKHEAKLADLNHRLAALKLSEVGAVARGAGSSGKKSKDDRACLPDRRDGAPFTESGEINT